MIPSPTLPWFELARFGRSRVTRLAVLAVVAVPLFYAAMTIWANLDPTDNLDRVPAAVVNADEVVETTGPDGEEQPVAVGRQLAGNLVSDDSGDNYDWILTDARDAQDGLADGTYQAVLTIPENLSAAATSTAGDPSDAVQGQLDLRTNDAVNYLNGDIAETILTAARSAVNTQVTEAYLDNIYLSFSDLKVSLTDAADGAADLTDGADQLADGTSRLADGAGDLAAGNRQLTNGAAQVDTGARRLAGGLDQLEARTAPLPGQANRLADGARQVADGNAALNATVQDVTGAILAATDDANVTIDQIATRIDQVAAQCEAAAGEIPAGELDCSLLRAAADQAGAVKSGVSGVRDQAGRISSSTQQLADGAAQVATGNEQLAAQVPALVGAISDASTGADQLAAGTGALAAGAADAATGADQLADAAAQLDDGARALAAGALELTTGLRDGAGQVPDYDEDERDRLATTAATPIEDAAQRVNAVSGYGEGLAPYLVALALWFGAMAVYLLLRPLSARAVASTTGSIRTALAGFAPGLALGALQVVLLLAVVVGLLGLGPASPGLLVIMAVATAVTFLAINQALVALLGSAGRLVSLVLVTLQLTSVGATFPIQTSASFFGLLHHLLPMGYAVDGLRTAFAGGSTGIVTDLLVLGLFTALALAVTVVAARRRQTFTMARLHPTLRV